MPKDNDRGEARRYRIGSRARLILFIVVVVALLVSAKVFGLGERMGDLRDWIGGLGSWGFLVFILIYIIAVVAAIPGSAMTVAAGALFGSVFGVVCVSIASTVGAGIAFLIARYVARDTVVRWLSHNEKFRRLDQLTEDHGAVIVALTRLVPIFPFNFLNYGFGLTRVSFWTYLLWSWMCMLPGTILYVVGADAFTDGLSRGKISWVLIATMAGVAVGLFYLVRFARNKLQAREHMSEKRHKREWKE